MSNQKINYNALTAANHVRASDLRNGKTDSSTPPVSCEAQSPLRIRSLVVKLETNHNRRSLFGRCDRDASRGQRPSTQPRSVPTDFDQDDFIKKGRGRRSKVEYLGHHLRHSLLLSGRQQPADDANSQLNDEPAVFRIRPDTRHGPSCNTPREHFKTGKQYYRHLKKSSISPPFGFEHITHAFKEQLPGIIESVDERDLTAKFWAVNRGQRPRRSLRGIQADDLPERRLTMAPANAGRPCPASHDESRRRSSASTTGDHHHSTSPGLRKDSATLQTTQDGPSVSASPLRSQHMNPTSHGNPGRSKNRVSFTMGPSVQEADKMSESLSSIQNRRPHRTLPPLPEQTALFMDVMDERWEDDVDFSYGMEAEATCEFDWETATATANPASSPVSADGDNRDSVWSTPSMNRSPVSPSFQQVHPSGTPPPRPVDPPHRRAPSVGHRGFLAARSSNASLSATAASQAPTVQITPYALDASLPPPHMNLVMPNELSSKASSTHLNLSALQPSTLEELSDPESTRTGGSKHRKSSSFGSSSSVGARSVRSAHDGGGNRWSLASIASVPELLYSHRRNKTSISKMRISAPLESPSSSPKRTNDPHAAPNAEFENPRGKITTHRSQKPGDRAVVQADERASQRGRALASSSTQRRSPLGKYRSRETSALGNGPEWI